jgi:uncharacterized protein YggE
VTRPSLAAALLLSCAALAGCDRSSDTRGLGRDEVLLQVMASGRTEVRPDEARFSVGVSNIGATSAAASAANNTVMNRTVASLDRLGIKEADVQTRAISLARIDYGPERGRFRAENLVEVRVRDLKLVSPAIAAATEAGGNVVAGPNLQVADPELAENPAYAKAYRAARARADAYAKAAGLKVARVLAIQDGSIPPISYGYGYGASAPDSFAANAPPPPVQTRAAGPPVRAGVDVREVTVRADFALVRAD